MKQLKVGLQLYSIRQAMTEDMDSALAQVKAMGYGNTEVFLTRKEREALIAEYLGKTVTVEIDRPIGFHHVTKGVHLDYTINYGFLPGVIGGDGEEQDVYILGVSQPVDSFYGRVIGVGSGSSKKRAEQDAARMAMERLYQQKD